jgi:SAM-dependent methyltransferase
MAESIEFPWKSEEFSLLYDACEQHDGMKILFDILKRKDKNINILEAGCGIGATVKCISDKGYKDVTGIELNKEAVGFINKTHPELNIIQGDILNMPFENNYFDVVASFGVVEHFPKGFSDPLKALYRVLKPEGIAVITVPSLNRIRVFKHYYRKMMWIINPKKNKNIRSLFGKPTLEKPKYYIYPEENSFFEYRLTKHQFEQECKKAGFNVIESKPICHIDGLFHVFGWTGIISFKDWRFSITGIGKIANKILKSIPFLHNHMHALIVTKP